MGDFSPLPKLKNRYRKYYQILQTPGPPFTAVLSFSGH